MPKNILYIVLGLVLILLAGVGIFQVFKTKTNTNTSTTNSSSGTSDQPLFGDTGSGTGSDSLFSGTPNPGTNADGNTLTVNSKGICSDQWGGLPDADNDGLPDSVETIYKTDPANPNTDSDDYKDGEEVKNGYDPLISGDARLDSDNDGLTDDQECRWKTDPFNPDTDGDGYQDGAEVKNGFDPTLKGDGKGSDALPEKQAQLSDAGLRPNPNSSNYTEGLAGIIIGDTPLAQAGQTKVTTEQVQTILATAKLDLTMPETNTSELNIQETNTSTDVSAYLAKMDSLKPAEILNANNLSDSLLGAFSGNTTGVAAIRTNLSTYEKSLLAMPVPPSAVDHITLLISTTRFLNERLNTIQQYGQSDPTRAYIAAREIQEGLPKSTKSLDSIEEELKGLT